jgi:energy-coupling factor transporter ATP-binding protein EcfA2
MELLDQLNSGGLTIVIITHDAAVAAHAGRTVAISDGMQALVTAGQQSPVRGQNPTGPPGPPTAAQNQAQIAMAMADANCTLSSDLAGIYFAVQANYEQQFVSANQQALDAGVREYKAAFAKALKTMPTLLQTTSATPNLPGPPPSGHHGRHGQSASPSPSPS